MGDADMRAWAARGAPEGVDVKCILKDATYTDAHLDGAPLAARRLRYPKMPIVYAATPSVEGVTAPMCTPKSAHSLCVPSPGTALNNE